MSPQNTNSAKPNNYTRIILQILCCVYLVVFFSYNYVNDKILAQRAALETEIFERDENQIEINIREDSLEVFKIRQLLNIYKKYNRKEITMEEKESLIQTLNENFKKAQYAIRLQNTNTKKNV